MTKDKGIALSDAFTVKNRRNSELQLQWVSTARLKCCNPPISNLRDISNIDSNSSEKTQLVIWPSGQTDRL